MSIRLDEPTGLAPTGNASGLFEDDPGMAVSCAMKFAPSLSHEIRYAFWVHGGILIPGVAMLLRDVSLMVQVQAGI